MIRRDSSALHARKSSCALRSHFFVVLRFAFCRRCSPRSATIGLPAFAVPLESSIVSAAVAVGAPGKHCTADSVYDRVPYEGRESFRASAKGQTTDSTRQSRTREHTTGEVPLCECILPPRGSGTKVPRNVFSCHGFRHVLPGWVQRKWNNFTPPPCRLMSQVGSHGFALSAALIAASAACFGALIAATDVVP